MAIAGASSPPPRPGSGKGRKPEDFIYRCDLDPFCGLARSEMLNSGKPRNSASRLSNSASKPRRRARTRQSIQGMSILNRRVNSVVHAGVRYAPACATGAALLAEEREDRLQWRGTPAEFLSAVIVY